MIKHYFITGDTHSEAGTIARLKTLKTQYLSYDPAETALIILGDVGFNYWLNKKDWKHKKHAAEFGYHIYCVRGNHEERPENLAKNAPYQAWDAEVGGVVYVDSDFSNIRYLKDGGEYTIGGKSCLVIGGR